MSTGFQIPQNYRWLFEFHSNLYSKFTLFFSRILSKIDQQAGNDFKSQSARTDTDYYAAFILFFIFYFFLKK